MPIPVKTRPRFKCQFCLSYRATIKAVEKHEGFCWQNPNRYCDCCDNKGFYRDVIAECGTHEEWKDFPCPYCSKEDKDVTRQLKELKHKGG